MSNVVSENGKVAILKTDKATIRFGGLVAGMRSTWRCVRTRSTG